MLAKISLTISILLSIAVTYLLYKTSGTAHSAIDHNPEVEVAAAFSGDSAARPTVLAYINGDSLNASYAFIVEKSKDLEQKMAAAELRVRAAFGSRQQKYDQNMRYAQEHPDMPESEAMALQNEIEQLQAEMDGIQEREVGTLKRKETELQVELMNRVNSYLKEFTRARGIDYVINHQSEINLILYGNNAYDITSEVLAGLNAEYAAEKEKK